MNENRHRLQSIGVGSLLLVATAVGLSQAPAHAENLGTKFTYQGHLEVSGVPANGLYDMRFRLYDAPTIGNQIGPMQIHDGVTHPSPDIVDGLFTVILDFGQPLAVDKTLWLEVEVRPDGPTGYTNLQPRVEITPAPRAVLATRAVDGVGLPNVLEVDSVNSRIGIGTNLPGSTLDVAGEVRSTGAMGGQVTSYNPNNQGASVHLSWLDDMARIRVGGTGAGSANGLDIQHGGNTSLLRILDSGNVGIGTISPETRLHLVGGSEATVSGGGYLTLGTTTGVNLAFDTNEIQARSNASAAALELNPGGGDVNIAASGALTLVNGTLRVGTDTLYADPITQFVGLNTTTPTERLHVVGNIVYTGTITDISDERLKQDIAPVEDALSKLSRLRGVYFNMIDTPEEREVGLIAQDVQAVLPEAVRIVDRDKGYLGVAYPSVIPLLVEAIKSQSQIVEAQRCSLETQSELIQQHKNQLDVKDHQINELAARLERLERAILEREGND